MLPVPCARLPPPAWRACLLLRENCLNSPALAVNPSISVYHHHVCLLLAFLAVHAPACRPWLYIMLPAICLHFLPLLSSLTPAPSSLCLLPARTHFQQVYLCHSGWADADVLLRMVARLQRRFGPDFLSRISYGRALLLGLTYIAPHNCCTNHLLPPRSVVRRATT